MCITPAPVTAPSGCQPENNGAKGLVLVTGANGYVGSHVIYQLLAMGHRVRGTLRKPDDPKNGFLYKIHPLAGERLELVHGDLTKSDCWATAMEGVEVVMHVASPFQIDPNATEEQFVKPAVTGTVNVVRAAIHAGVRRLVLTSSIAAVTEGFDMKDYRNGRVFNETDWTDTSKPSVGPYEKSKAIAELEGWAALKASGSNMEMVVICPGLIFGPVFDRSQAAQSASSDMMMKFLLRKYPVLPPVSMGAVDVRDVALAHIKAMQLPASVVDRQRFLCAANTSSFKDLCMSIDRNMRKYGFKATRHEISPTMAVALSYLKKDLRQTRDSNLLGRRSSLSTEKIRQRMDFEFRDLDRTLYEHSLSLIKASLVPRKNVPQKELDGLTIYG